MTFDLRARPLYLVLLLAVAASGVGLFALGRMHRSSDSPAQPPSAAAPVRRKAPAPAATPRKASVQNAPAPSPADRLPAAVRRALASDRVVVVAFYDPQAKIDGASLLEAKAGAKLADSAFVPIDVRRNGVESLNARYGVVQDPAILVLQPSGNLVVRIDGFADRDTVAQAAVNAGS